MATRLEQLEAMIAPAVEAFGLELWGLQLIQSQTTTLRIFIDAEAGIGIKDCEKVSRQVSSILDVEDPIASEFTLEVSSPGAERFLFKLEHYARFKGEKAKLVLRYPFEGRRKFSGLLRGVEGDDVILQIDDEEILLPIESIEKANVALAFGGSKKQQ